MIPLLLWGSMLAVPDCPGQTGAAQSSPPAPAPKAEAKPAPAPEKKTAAAPASTPAPAPKVESKPAPAPEKKTAAAPASTPPPAPKAEAKPAPAPEKKTAAAPAPVSSPKPKTEPAPEKQASGKAQPSSATASRETAGPALKDTSSATTRSSRSTASRKVSAAPVSEPAAESSEDDAETERRGAAGSIRSLFGLGSRKKNLGLLRPVAGLASKEESTQAGVAAASKLAAELPGVPEGIAKRAREAFEQGSAFYIYTDQRELWRGQGAVEGKIRYIKNPETRRAPVKVYAYADGKDVQGNRQRFGSFGDTEWAANPQGELCVVYGGVRRKGSLSQPSATRLSGKALLHVTLHPATAGSRFGGHGGRAISNELAIPVQF